MRNSTELKKLSKTQGCKDATSYALYENTPDKRMAIDFARLAHDVARYPQVGRRISFIAHIAETRAYDSLKARAADLANTGG